MESTKDKIDKLLGISPSQTVDDVLNDLSLDTEKISETMADISEEVKSNLEKIDQSLGLMSENGPNSLLTLSDINKTMKEVEDLISLSKQMFRHIYEYVLSSELIDSEVIGSCAKLLESIHINISEFISMYKDKQRYVEKIKIMTYQQQQKIELMNIKHKMDLEKIQLKAKESEEVIDIPGGIVTLNQDAIVKMLNNIEENQESKKEI